jgi:diguanylate cyclase (GGDEF)-like protein
MAGALDEGHRTLSRRATCDSLTGLPNRAAFQRRLEGHLAPAQLRRPEAVGVLFIDVDDFKYINDSLGHAAGDAVLVDIAERLSACVRPSDLVARLGGDEFVILVNDQISASHSAEAIAQRILEAFNIPFTIADQQVSVAVSIGISVARHDTDDAERLLGEADLAMYSAKRHGKGRREVFDASMQN